VVDSLTKNPEEMNPPRKICTRCFEGGPLSPDSLLGNLSNREAPRRGEIPTTRVNESYHKYGYMCESCHESEFLFGWVSAHKSESWYTDTHRDTHTHTHRDIHNHVTHTDLCLEAQVCVCLLIVDDERTNECVAVCCSVLQCVAVCCSVLQCVAVCCSVLQCVAVYCSVLQCAAVCCSVL